MTNATKPPRASRASASTSLELSVLGAFQRFLLPAEPAKSEARGAKRRPKEPMARRSRTGKSNTLLPEAAAVYVDTVRIRPEGVDRQLRMEYTRDPDDEKAMIVRIRLASEKALPEPAPAKPDMLTTQAAADILKVSRPYVVRLIDTGKVAGVERTQAGHRRIPRAEVMRIQAKMRATRRTALDAWSDVESVDEASERATKTKSRWAVKG
jgi:excisionase family DNA binding protein